MGTTNIKYREGVSGTWGGDYQHKVQRGYQELGVGATNIKYREGLSGTWGGVGTTNIKYSEGVS